MKKRPLELGDIFPVPSKIGDDYGFYFARAVNVSVSYTIEVFDGFEKNFSITDKEVSEKSFDISNRLYPPLMAIFLFGDKILPTAWPILGKDEAKDDFESIYSDVVFVSPEYDELGTYFKGGEEFRDLSRNISAERSTIWQPHQLVFRTWYYANDLRNKGSIFDKIKNDRELLAAGLYDKKLQEAIDISEAVAKKFIESGVDRCLIKARSRRRPGKALK